MVSSREPKKTYSDILYDYVRTKGPRTKSKIHRETHIPTRSDLYKNPPKGVFRLTYHNKEKNKDLDVFAVSRDIVYEFARGKKSLQEMALVSKTKTAMNIFQGYPRTIGRAEKGRVVISVRTDREKLLRYFREKGGYTTLQEIYDGLDLSKEVVRWHLKRMGVETVSVPSNVTGLKPREFLVHPDYRDLLPKNAFDGPKQAQVRACLEKIRSGTVYDISEGTGLKKTDVLKNMPTDYLKYNETGEHGRPFTHFVSASNVVVAKQGLEEISLEDAIRSCGRESEYVHQVYSGSFSMRKDGRIYSNPNGKGRFIRPLYLLR